MNIYDNSGISIEVLPLGPIGTNVGIISNNGRGFVVDAPPDSADAVLNFAKENNIKLEALLITHEHWDHRTDASKLRSHGLTVYANEIDTEYIENPEAMGAPLMLDIVNPCKVDISLSENEKIEVCGINIEVRTISGHVRGGSAYYFHEIGICFVGDTLFAMTVGRSDFAGGDKKLLFENIRNKLYTLPDHTIIVPGHGRLTNIGNEKEHNLYVRPHAQNAVK